MPARRGEKHHRNVMRVDGGKDFHGYHVRVRRGGKLTVVCVSDGVFGGRRGARREALRVRDELEARLPPPVKIHTRTRNATGIPGVWRMVIRHKRGWLYVGYAAQWRRRSLGQRVQKSFSVRKYGEAKALRLAIEARRLGVLELLRNSVRRMGRGRVEG